MGRVIQPRPLVGIGLSACGYWQHRGARRGGALDRGAGAVRCMDYNDDRPYGSLRSMTLHTDSARSSYGAELMWKEPRRHASEDQHFKRA